MALHQAASALDHSVPALHQAATALFKSDTDHVTAAARPGSASETSLTRQRAAAAAAAPPPPPPPPPIIEAARAGQGQGGGERAGAKQASDAAKDPAPAGKIAFVAFPAFRTSSSSS